MSRQAAFYILVGTNGTGKSTFLKKLLKINDHNLILPAGPFDPAWDGFEQIAPESTFITDPRDFKQQRKIVDWSVPKINAFKGDRVLKTIDIATDADQVIIWKKIASQKTGFVSGGLFVDDFKEWIPAQGNIDKTSRSLFVSRRHRGIDLFFACHSFQDVNGDLIKFNPIFIVFETSLPANDSVKAKTGNYSELEACMKRVNERAKINPHYCEQFIPRSFN